MRTAARVFLATLTTIMCLSLLAWPFPVSAQTNQPEMGNTNSVWYRGGPGGQDLSNILDSWKKEANPKLDSALNQVVNDPSSPALAALAVQDDNQTAGPAVRVIVESLPDNESAAREASASYGSVETEYNGLLQVILPVSKISELAAQESIGFIRLPYHPVPDAVVSEGVGVTNATAWQNAGYRGSGVKIAVLDGGFAGYTALQSQGELPANITTHWSASLAGPGSDNHGCACAEIIYDFAPDATFYFANYDTDVEMGTAVDWLISQGVNIISHSMSSPGYGAGNGSGPIDDIANRACNAGILWSQSAGNYALGHWSGSWTDIDNNGVLEFNTTLMDEFDGFYVPNGQSIMASLNWNDIWGSSSNNYDLFLLNKYGSVVSSSLNPQNGNGNPYETLEYTATYDGYYYLAIATNTYPAPRFFNLYVHNWSLHYNVPAGSISVPGDSSQVMTVGAVAWNNSSVIEPFSSQGPNTFGVIKPDVLAPDGVSTSTLGVANFYGTSATAPCAAGVAAIVKQANPAFTNVQLKAYLESHAVDLGTAGKDNIFGSGRLTLPNPPGKIMFMTSTQNLTAGTISAGITVQTQDAAGNPLNALANTDISLTSSSTGGRFDTSAGGGFTGAITKVTIPIGANSAGFFYKDTKSGTPTLTASSAGMTSGTQQESIAAAAAASLSIATAPVIGASVDVVFAAQPVVRAADQFGNPVSGVTITASRGNLGTGAMRGTPTAVTASTGLATFTDLGYSKAGEPFNIHFSATGATPVDSAQLGPLSPGGANQISIATQPVAGTNVDAALTTQPVILLLDQFNNPKNGVVVTASLAAGTGVLRGTLTATSNASGLAAFTNLGYNKSGEAFQLRFTAGSLFVDGPSLGPLAVGAAAAISVQTQPSSAGSVDDNLTVQPGILVLDQYGNPKSGISVVASKSTGTGNLRGTSTSVTGPAGLATFSDLGYSKSGESFKIRFTGGALFVDSNSVGPLGPGAATAINIATAPVVGASVDAVLAVQPVIRVIDQFSNPKDGVTVTVSAGADNTTLRGTKTAVSAASGLATFSDLKYSKAGETFTLHFTAGVLSVNSAALGPLTAGAAAVLSVATQPVKGASVDVILSVQPVIRVVDQFGNARSGVAVTAARGTGTGNLRGAAVATSSASGLAVFTDLGYSKAGESFTLHFTAGTLTVDSNAIDMLAPGAAKTLSVATQPAKGATVDAILATQPVVLVVDQYNNPKDGVQVTASRASGSGALRGTYTVTSNISGLAAYTDLGYSKSGEPFTIHFVAGTLTVDSNPVASTGPGAAAQIRVETNAAGTGTLVGAQILVAGNSLAVYAVTRDQFSNFVGNPADAGWSLVGITGHVAGTDISPASGASAVVTAHLAGTAAIHCAKTGLTSVDSGTITINMGPPTKLTIQAAPLAGTSVDDNLTAQPVIILVQDAGNNPVGGVVVTASVGTGTGTLRGVLTATSTIDGQAVFNNLGYNKSGESFKIRFTAGALTAVSDTLGPLSTGALASISLTVLPVAGPSVDDNFTVQPVILTVDGFGNRKAGVAVTASKGAGNGALRGTFNTTSNSSGLATFTDLGYSISRENFSLHFSAGSVFTDSASMGPILPGAPTLLTISLAPVAGASVDAILATQPVIRVADQFGNLKDGVSVTASSAMDNSTLRGTLTSISSVSGLAAFTNLGYSKAGVIFALHFAAGNLFVNSPSLGPLSAGAATKISIVTQPVAGPSVDDNFTVQPVIRVADQFDNPNMGTTVQASHSYNNGTFRGSLSVATGSLGLAAFSDLGYSKSNVTFSITFNVGQLSVTSAQMGPMAAGTASQIGVENSVDGSGMIVESQAVLVNDNLTVFGVTRDQFGNYAGHPDNTTWSLTDIHGGIKNGDLHTAAGDNITLMGDNITLTGHLTGYTIIHASNNSLTSIDSGNIFVNLKPPHWLSIAVDPVPAASVDEDFAMNPSIKVEDADNTTLGGVAVTASLRLGSGKILGSTHAISDASGIASFLGMGYTKAGEAFKLLFTVGNFTVESQSLGPLSTGSAVSLQVETKADGSGVVPAAQSLTTGSALTVHGVSRDQYGNFIANSAGTWSLVNASSGVQNNDLVPSADNLTAVFTAHQTGSAIIRVAANNLDSVDSGLITVAAPQTGGGGGGGGGGVNLKAVTLSGMAAGTSLLVNGSGVTQYATRLTTADGQVTLDIAAGTRLLTANTAALSTISAAVLSGPPAPPSGQAVVLAYALGPEGARFSPGITLSFAYDPAALPANIAESDLSVAFYDGANWQTMSAAFDAQKHQLGVIINHFSIYALLGKLSEKPVQPSPSPSPVVTPSPSVTPSPTLTTTTTPPAVTAVPATSPAVVVTTVPLTTSAAVENTAIPTSTTQPVSTPVKPFNWIIVIIPVVVVAVLAVAIMLFARRPKKKA